MAQHDADNPDLNWQPADEVQRILTVDTHTAGEPLRIILSGLPDLGNGTVHEKRKIFIEKYDHLRTGLLLEPRGHNDMYGAIVSEAKDNHGVDVFFINAEHYSPMCGHAILALAHLTFETTLLGKHDPTMMQIFNTPAGPCYARVRKNDRGVTEAYFKNVASFFLLRDKTIDVPDHGPLRFDVAFGGAFYAIVEAKDLRVELTASCAQDLIQHARKIKKTIHDNHKIEHPSESSMNGLFGVIFVSPPQDKKNHSRNVNVFEDSGIDRSPTGTGISARCALHFARGELKLGERITIESIIGSEMSVEAVEETKFGPYDAVIPQVSGSAFVTGRHELYFHPDDPYKAGFAVR